MVQDCIRATEPYVCLVVHCEILHICGTKWQQSVIFGNIKYFSSSACDTLAYAEHRMTLITSGEQDVDYGKVLQERAHDTLNQRGYVCPFPSKCSSKEKKIKSRT